jgi:hypothetical protein
MIGVGKRIVRKKTKTLADAMAITEYEECCNDLLQAMQISVHQE